MKFAIGDVLYINSEQSYRKSSVVIITDINITKNGDMFYYVTSLEGYDYDWFMGGSPLLDDCTLMVSNLNEAEQLAMLL